METALSTSDTRRPDLTARPFLRALFRLDWWPRTDDAGSVPLWVHLLFWGCMLLLDGLKLYSYQHDPKTSLTLRQVVACCVLTDVLSGTLFYANWMLLVPRTLGRGKLAPYIMGVLGLLLLYLPLRYGTAYLAKGAMNELQSKLHPWVMIVPYTLMGLSTIFFSSGLRVTGDYLRSLSNRRELERQQLLTELAMLKTQINPHFLFNTLNNIYSLTSRKSDKAPEAVLRLSEIMRYLLYESSTDTVPLSRELAHLRSFLDLQRLRLPAAAQDAIRFETTGYAPDSAYPVAPLLLLPLVENAFKHGDLTARPVAVDIQLSLAPDGLLRFSVLNYVAPADAHRDLPQQPGGVGLANLRRRLELLYPSRYALDVQTHPGQHQVTLVLLP